MWGSKKRKKVTQIDTLIGKETQITGNIDFVGGLHIDGKLTGNINAPMDSGSVLTVSEQGMIEGEVRVPNIIMNGTVHGDVHAVENIELAPHAHVKGNVYYNLIEMAMGAEVNGSLIHISDKAKSVISSKKTPSTITTTNSQATKDKALTTEKKPALPNFPE